MSSHTGYRVCRQPCLSGSLALFLWIGCADGSPPGESGQTAADGELAYTDELLLAASKVALPPPGVAPGDLPDPGSLGAQYVQKYCTACHELPSPTIHSATDWPAVARRMWLRMGRIAPVFTVPIPEAGARVTTLRYLMGNALKVSGATLPPGEGRALFSATCSRCHELPDPRQHAPEDWVAVVRRMMERMEWMLGETLSPTDMTAVVLYLEGVSKAASTE